MNDENVVRLWKIVYFISGIFIPFMIIVNICFNRFNVFNIILSFFGCFFQLLIFLSLRLRNQQTLFIYATIFLTIIHFNLLIYLIFMSKALTKNIRDDLEKEIRTNQTQFKYRLQIKFCEFLLFFYSFDEHQRNILNS